MSDLIQEMQDELFNSIDNLRDAFGEYDFSTKDGLSVADLDGIDGFESIAVKDDKPLSFHQFKKIIKNSLFSEDEDLSVKEFDWDNIEIKFDHVISLYSEFMEMKEQVEDNLTGEQTFDSIELLDEDDLKQQLLDYAIENDLIYGINTAERGNFYLVNAHFQKKLG